MTQTTKAPSTYQHVRDVFAMRPRDIAKHLWDIHHVPPTPARPRYARESWGGQHERLHYHGISGFIQEVPSDHTT